MRPPAEPCEESMAGPSMVILESDHERFTATLSDLCREANAKFAFLIDRAGQHLASAGDLTDVDPTALASLTAGNVAATEGVAQLVGENEFTSLYHEGRSENLHITLVGSKVILLVTFDERSSLGLVRLRVEQALPHLTETVQEMIDRATAGPQISTAAPAGLGDITDDDIEALFG